GVRDMHGRAKITIEFLNLCEGKRICERREFGLRVKLRHKAQQCWSFGERAAVGHQSGDTSFRVYREVFGAFLALSTKIDQNRLIGRTRLFKCDVRRQSTGAGSIVKPEHECTPFSSPTVLHGTTIV